MNPITPNASILLMPANALGMQHRSDGHVIRNSRHLSLDRSNLRAQHRITLEMRFRQLPCPLTQLEPHRRIVRKSAEGTRKFRAVLRCNHKSVLGNYFP
jgi:hypothetical protein